jgi:hypothetical protein
VTGLGLVGRGFKGKEYELDDVIFKVFPLPSLISCYIDKNVNELFLNFRDVVSSARTWEGRNYV